MAGKLKGKTESFENCAQCSKPVCFTSASLEQAPGNCPVRTKPGVVESAKNKTLSPELHQFAYNASKQESSCYVRLPGTPSVLSAVKTRLEETIEFANRMDYGRLGVAFCIGTSEEGQTLVEILKDFEFEVVSVCCKCGSIPKEELSLESRSDSKPGRFRAMCNPILQAELLNDANTDFNIMLGLCVGHDSLFLKHAKAFTTVLATKDRVLAHNAMAALYLSRSFLRRVRIKERYPDSLEGALTK